MNGAALYLAIDQGTHASRAVVLDARGAVVATGSKEIGLTRPQPDRAEQDGEAMVASIYASSIRSPSPGGVNCSTGTRSRGCWPSSRRPIGRWSPRSPSAA